MPADSFRLEVADDGLASLVFDRPDRRVNLLGTAVLEELEQVVADLARRTDLSGLVLLSGKSAGFVAGADLEEIAAVDDPALAATVARKGQAVFTAWSHLPFPTFVAIDGPCMGGGTEWSLASTWILAADSRRVRIGLPEIKLGIVPGWGGCSRLPRRVGLEAALDIILAGRDVDGRKALRLGLADALLPAAGFRRHVRRFALDRLAGKATPPRRAGLRDRLLTGNPVGRSLVFQQARKKVLARSGGNYPAPLRALEVIQVGVERGLSAGLEAEARAIGDLVVSPVCKNLVHLFRLMEEARKRPGLPGAEARGVRSAAVIGAGVMGGGIAHLLADKGDLPVRLLDIRREGLAAGMAQVSTLLDKQVTRRRLEDPERRRRLTLVRPALGAGDLGRADLVVEAVVEKLEVKRQVLAAAAAQLEDDAVIASNTSSLDIDEIAAETSRPERVVGMHFFNPVDKMPLVEVVAGEGSSPAAVNTVIALAQRLGKLPVVVKSAPGFLVNRLLSFYTVEALWLVHEGHPVEVIDRVMEEWGMPVGPIALVDEVGLDVAFEVAGVLARAFPGRLPLPRWLQNLAGGDHPRLGRKNGRGFYLYDDDGGRRQGPDPSALAGLDLPAPHYRTPDDAGLVDRMVLPMVDEAARCLAEGVVASPSDVDLAMVAGTGFPAFRGGLLRWADRQGVARLVVALERLANSVDERFLPSSALRTVADRGGFYSPPDGV